MQITMKFQGLDKVKDKLRRLSGQQRSEAFAKAINDTAYEVRRKMQAEMTSVFDRPTPYVLKSSYVKPATPAALSAEIMPTYLGKQGVDPQQILRAQADGGSRRDKKSEVLLRRHGWLPAGFQTVIPDPPFPGSVDAFGNIKGGFIVQVLSYLQLSAEQGYFQNMKANGMANLKQYGSATKPKKTMSGPRLGRTYFIAGGRTTLQIAGGDRMVMRQSGGRRTKHLQPGVWAKLGDKGAYIKPVLLFVRAGSYSQRLSMDRIAKSADTDNYLAKRLRYRIRQAFEAQQGE